MSHATFLDEVNQRRLAALLTGTVFGLGLGLAISGMIDPHKVLGFLDITGAWDASLLLVLGAAVVVAFTGSRLVLKRPAPMLERQLLLPSQSAIDAPLVLGAIVFGIGWGLSGYCPDPAIVSLPYANPEAWIVLPAIVAGNLLRRWQARGRHAVTAATPLPGCRMGSPITRVDCDRILGFHFERPTTHNPASL